MNLAQQFEAQGSHKDTRRERVLLAAIRKTRQTIEQFPHLDDRAAFALQVLADFADFQLHHDRELNLDRLQSDFSVRVSSDSTIHSI